MRAPRSGDLRSGGWSDLAPGRKILPVSQSSDWRRARWEATHQRIYETAIRLFQEKGFERVSVGQIATRSGVSVPTFYAHYPSKEHIVMQVPTADEMVALLSTQPADLPIGERIRRGAHAWFSQWGPDERTDTLARWQIIAATPALRTRAAEFERTTAGYVADAMPAANGALRPGDSVVINAYLSAYTAGLLAWADCNGDLQLEKLVEEAFQALEQS